MPDPVDPAAPEPAPAPEPEKTITLTQAQLDRMMGERVGQERKKYEGFDELKAKAEQFDKLEEANKTELQKANDRAAAAEAAAQAAQSQSQALARRSAITAAAAAAGAHVDDVLAHLSSSDAVTIDDAGQVTGADTAVASLLQAKPYLLKEAPRPGFAPVTQGPQGSGAEPIRVADLSDHQKYLKVKDRIAAGEPVLP